eukprot:Nk52_evm21s229 gene=Nk52_evmTU21s229
MEKSVNSDQPEASGVPVSTSGVTQDLASLSVKRKSVADSAPPSLTEPPTSPGRKRRPEDFNFGEVIGEGSYAVVKLATERKTGRVFAVKILDKRHVIKENKLKYVNIEKQVLSVLNNHPFFVRLYYTFQDPSRLYFVLSYASNGELLDYIRKLSSFDLQCTQFYVAEIVLALEYLHSMEIIHRDLKPENILLNGQMHIQLTDFGTARMQGLNDESPGKGNETARSADDKDKERQGGPEDSMPRESRKRANSFVGTAEYVSPELLTDKCASKSSDLWALGCIIYQLIAGKPPFRGANEYQTFQLIIKLELDFPKGFPEVAKDIIQKLLVLDPKERIGCEHRGGFAELKKHPFFKDITWDGLHLQTPPPLGPYLPPLSEEEVELRSEFEMSSLRSQRTEGISPIPESSSAPGIEEMISDKSVKRKLLEKQSENSRWRAYVGDQELILKEGKLLKRGGFFSRDRVVLVTDHPRLMVIDQANCVIEYDIDLIMEDKERSSFNRKLYVRNVSVELKNEKTFFLHTKEAVMYFEDPQKNASCWVDCIKGTLKFFVERE